MLNKGWTAANLLQVGDGILTEAGHWQAVEGIRDTGIWTTVYNVCVADWHTYFVGRAEWGWSLWAHNANYKQGGKLTEPTLPPREVVNTNGVKIEHYFRGTDHPPPHLHVYGKGPKTKIGANGKPLSGEPELSAAQRDVVEEHLSTVRAATNKIRRWLWFWAQPD